MVSSIAVEHVDGCDAVLGREVELFYLSLDRELDFLRTRPDEVGKAKTLLLARVDGELAGMIGVVRRFGILPCTFIVVKSPFQRQGVATMLYEARLPCCRLYLVIFSIVISGNRAGMNFFRRVGEEMLFDDGRHAFFATAPRGSLRCLFPLFRLLLPLLLKLWYLAARLRRR